jgi:uncharacterized protein
MVVSGLSPIIRDDQSPVAQRSSAAKKRLAGLKPCATSVLIQRGRSTSRWSLVVRRWSFVVGLALTIVSTIARGAGAQTPAPLPELTQPVNDFAHEIDPASASQMDRMIRTLLAASGDVVVVVTVPTIEGYGDIREYAVKLFENRGRGIGQKGKNNGLLILLTVKERRVWVEVGYDLEQWITDGFAGETSRNVMTPEFRNGRYGAGLLAGTERIIGRIAQGRNITLEGVRVPTEPLRQRGGTGMPVSIPFLIFIAILIISRLGGGGPRRRFWGGMGGWSSGVGPFGGGWGGGGGGGGGGFGGGFGGFGGGSSGGGGGGSSW